MVVLARICAYMIKVMIIMQNEFNWMMLLIMGDGLECDQLRLFI